MLESKKHGSRRASIIRIEKCQQVYPHKVIIESFVRVMGPEATWEQAEEQVGGKEAEVVNVDRYRLWSLDQWALKWKETSTSFMAGTL